MNFTDPADKYRFYVCVERKNILNSYECILGDVKTVNDVIIAVDRSILVPVDKRLPKVFDFMLINNALKPTFSIVR